MKENKQFRKDLATVRDVMVWVPRTGSYMKVRKQEALDIAKDRVVKYCFSTRVFANKRQVIVIE